MLHDVLLIVAWAVVLTIPVLLSAKLFSAGNDGLLICFATALLSSLVFQIVTSGNKHLTGILAGAIAMGFVYKSLLKLNFFNGIWASFIATGIQILFAQSLNAHLARFVTA